MQLEIFHVISDICFQVCGWFRPSIAFNHRELALVPLSGGPEQICGSIFNKLKFLPETSPEMWFLALYCVPQQINCTFCTLLWPWTTPWVQFEITNEPGRSNYDCYHLNWVYKWSMWLFPCKEEDETPLSLTCVASPQVIIGCSLCLSVWEAKLLERDLSQNRLISPKILR